MKLDAKTVAASSSTARPTQSTSTTPCQDSAIGSDAALAARCCARGWCSTSAPGHPRITLGSAEVLGAEQARQAAKKALAKVRLGEDPAGERRERRGKDLLTMRSQAVEYLAAKEHELAKRTLIEMRRYLTDPRYFGPLHKLAIDTITRRDIAARVVVIMRECGNPTAARARGALGSFFTWA